MSLEKRFAAVPPQLFTVNGTANGVVTITDSSLFKVKQVVIVASTARSNLELEVKNVMSPTEIVVGPRTGNIFATTDISAYLTTDGANIFANEQKRPVITADEFERATYEEEPTVAKRAILVDEFGNKITQSNPLPTTAVVNLGNISIGTVGQGAPNTAANAWPVKVTDGTDTLSVNPDGSLPTKPKQASTNNITTVASSLANQMFLAANPNRIGATVYNESTQILYLKLGAVASATSYTVQMGPKTYFEAPYGYTGQIDGLWVGENGFARVGELT